MSFSKKFTSKSPIANNGDPLKPGSFSDVAANTKAFSTMSDILPKKNITPPQQSTYGFGTSTNANWDKPKKPSDEQKAKSLEMQKKMLEVRDSKAGTKVLDDIQDKLETAGMTPGVGIVPDAINTGISAARGLSAKFSGDKKAQLEAAKNMGIHGASMLPVGGIFAAGGNKLKKAYSKLDKAFFPNTAFRAVPASGANRTTYSKGKEQLMEKIQKKGDFYTKDIDEAKFYATGNFSGTKGLKQGDDVIFTETKIPFWRNPVTKDKDVVKLKSLDKDVANPSEYLIPSRGFSSIFYPKKSTRLKAVPDHILDPRYKDAISLGDPADPSSGISQYLKTSEAKYIDDQIKGAESFSTKFNKRKGNFYYEK